MSIDLTQRPPRSPRVRLGGYVLLPRMLDKCRAEIAGKNGEYHYNCPLDQRFLSFTGIDHEALKTEVAKDLGDADIFAWIEKSALHKRSDYEIAHWSEYREAAVPSDNPCLAITRAASTSARRSPRREALHVKTSARGSTSSISTITCPSVVKPDPISSSTQSLNI